MLWISKYQVTKYALWVIIAREIFVPIRDISIIDDWIFAILGKSNAALGKTATANGCCAYGADGKCTIDSNINLKRTLYENKKVLFKIYW